MRQRRELKVAMPGTDAYRTSGTHCTADVEKCSLREMGNVAGQCGQSARHETSAGNEQAMRFRMSLCRRAQCRRYGTREKSEANERARQTARKSSSATPARVVAQMSIPHVNVVAPTLRPPAPTLRRTDAQTGSPTSQNAIKRHNSKRNGNEIGSRINATASKQHQRGRHKTAMRRQQQTNAHKNRTVRDDVRSGNAGVR